MREEADFVRRLSVMIVRCVRWVEFDDYDTSSLVSHLDFCCMDRTSDYCWFMSFLLTLLEQLDFEVHLRLFGRSHFYVGVDDFCWDLYYNHRFLLILAPPVFFFYSHLVFSPRYRPLLRAVALTEPGTCAFLRVLYTSYRSVLRIYGMPTALHIGRLTLC